MDLYYMTSLLVLIICAFNVCFMVARLGKVDGHTKDRIKYTAVLVLSLIGGMQPYYADYYPNGGLLALAVSMLIFMVDGVPAFRRYKDTNDFFDTEIYDPKRHGEENEFN